MFADLMRDKLEQAEKNRTPEARAADEAAAARRRANKLRRAQGSGQPPSPP